MIKFGKNDKVENIGILTKEEAKAYVFFLKMERDRHIEEIETCRRMIGIIPINADKEEKALEEFYESAIRRHRKDIEDIDVLVETVKHFHGI